MNKQELEKAHKVGDIHPNGKWVWKEIKPGKFDWRVIKKDAKKTTVPKKAVKGRVLDESDLFLRQIRRFDVKQLKQLHAAGKLKSGKVKNEQRLQDQLATIERAIELKSNGGSFKTWRDYMSYNEAKQYSDKLIEKPASEIQKELDRNIKLRDSAVSSTSTKLIARSNVWKLDRLLSAKNAANKANGYTAPTANGGSGTKVAPSGKLSIAKTDTTPLGKLKTEYLSTVDKDFADVMPKRMSAKTAEAKLLGSVIGDAGRELTSTIRGIKDVTTVTQLRKYDAQVDAVRRKAIGAIEDKIDILEHNAKLARGRSVNTYQSAIQQLRLAIIAINEAIPNGSYRIKDEAKIEEQLIKDGKW